MESVTSVIYSHLTHRLAGDTGADICEDFAEDVIILSSLGRFYGHDGVRRSATLLAEQLPGSSFSFRQTLIEGAFGFLEWTAKAPTSEVCDGADSFVVRDGRIILQTIHYTLTTREG